VCKKLVRASTCAFFRDLILTLLGLGFYKKICLKEGEFWEKFFGNLLMREQGFDHTLWGHFFVLKAITG